MFIEYWAHRVAKNPQLEKETQLMTMTVGSFKKQMKPSHAAGVRDRAAVSKALGDFGKENRGRSPLADMMDQIFGGGK